MKLKKWVSAFVSLTLMFTGICAVAPMAEESSKTKIYIVGDSTACIYQYDDNYALPRAGWGMYLPKYVNDNAEVVNLAMSGRSSKSFTTEDNYKTLISDVKAGDYVLIQFGHNDAKKSSDEDIANRYTNPEGDKDTEGSFKNSLYVNYIKPVSEAGATPVLLTPISRYSFDENGEVKDTHGLYDDAVLELANELDIDCVDMTEVTREIYNDMGNDAIIYHAIFRDNTKGTDGHDTTHLNHYGGAVIARNVAYNLASLDGIKNFINTVNVEDEQLYAVSGMTRGEFVAGLVRIMGFDAELGDDGKYKLIEPSDNFTDAKTSDYAYGVGMAKMCSLTSGRADGTFGVDESLTMQDMCVFAYRAMEIMGKPFKSVDGVKTNVVNVSDYARPAVNSVLAAFYDAAEFDGSELADRATCFYIYSMIYDNLYEADVNAEAQSIDQLEVVEKYDK